MKIKLLILSIAVLCLSTVPAIAVIYPTEDVTFGTSSDDPPTTLQNILDTMTVSPISGVSSIDTEEDALQDSWDTYWSISATTNASATMIIEIAGQAGSNTFGLYEPGNTDNYLQVFSGDATTGWYSVIHWDGTNVSVTEFDDSSAVQSSGSKNFGGNLFGLYLGLEPTGGDGPALPVFYSDSGLNSGDDHMRAYQGKDKDYVDILHPAAPEGNGLLWTINEFVLAWEDLPSSSWDRDYNDMVLMVESLVPIPVPAAVILGILGMSVAGLKLRKYA